VGQAGALPHWILQVSAGNLGDLAASNLNMKVRPGTLIAALIALAAAAAPAPAEVQEWRVDAAHSYVGFKVRHMMVSWVRGQFSGVAGTVAYDPADLSKTKVAIEIDASSIDTSNERRDKDLRGVDFFDVEKFPAIRFVSKRVEGNAERGLKLIGDLTLRGVTNEVTLDVEGPAPAVADGRGGEKSGVAARGKIKRSDFGLTWNRALEAGGVTVSDEVMLEIDVELARGGAVPRASAAASEARSPGPLFLAARRRPPVS
jgi:polyisoprenoid-binding protein YceI